VFIEVDEFKAHVLPIKPLLDELSSTHNIDLYNKLNYVGLGTILAGELLRPHIDCSPSMISLNIPISECNNSLNSVWRGWIGSQWDIGDKVNGVAGIEIDQTRSTIIESYTLDSATWVLPKIPHSVYHKGPGVRIMISLRFSEDPLHIFYKNE